MERIADRTVQALLYQLRKGDFVPEAFEVDVSLRIPLKTGQALDLRGRIDRMDVLEDEDRIYVKIMDYKSGSTSFDLALYITACSSSCRFIWTRLCAWKKQSIREKRRFRPGSFIIILTIRCWSEKRG